MPAQVTNTVKMFADDTKLYCKMTANHDGLQDDIDALVRWSETWLLPFNGAKCKTMHLGFHNPDRTYHLNGTAVAACEEERDLGIIIDRQLRFHKQTAAAVAKASQILAVIRRSFANLDEFTLPLLFKALVRPFLEFGNAIWGPFSKEDQKRLERVQRRATRLITDLRDLPYPDRLRRLGLPSLHYRRRRGDMVTVYQLFHGLLDVPLESLLTRHEAQNTRGHQWKLRKPNAKHLSRRNAFSVRIINDWNALPTDVVAAESLSSFKARLDRHWSSVMFDIPTLY
ncbi:uncharacterized protein LOC122378954 [Amphibalanus amphitrite]|uniref:uncharacterized protein LOC122378954 n=1 Tax=Amphibalanus amphitrite TaxID=1232801 RepID=UPI001C8FB858|nr:uncharacterized protein LOC122378954 [Amphibalanus amphitrite]